MIWTLLAIFFGACILTITFGTLADLRVRTLFPDLWEQFGFDPSRSWTVHPSKEAEDIEANRRLWAWLSADGVAMASADARFRWSWRLASASKYIAAVSFILIAVSWWYEGGAQFLKGVMKTVLSFF